MKELCNIFNTQSKESRWHPVIEPDLPTNVLFLNLLLLNLLLLNLFLSNLFPMYKETLTTSTLLPKTKTPLCPCPLQKTMMTRQTQTRAVGRIQFLAYAKLLWLFEPPGNIARP